MLRTLDTEDDDIYLEDDQDVESIVPSVSRLRSDLGLDKYAKFEPLGDEDDSTENEPLSAEDQPEPPIVPKFERENNEKHYVDNVKFCEALTAYRTACIKAEKRKRETPQISDYIGECFLKIATHLSRRPNFAGYSYREDMVSDGVENCLRYVRNFDPKKSKNPFSYFTQIIYYAFLRRLQAERKVQYTKYRVAERMVIDQDLATMPGYDRSNLDTAFLDHANVQDFVKAFDERKSKQRLKARSRVKVKS
jgi:hypothetical protein